MQTLLLALIPGLAALLWLFLAARRAAKAFEEVWEALTPLVGEGERAETRRAELESELDVRIKRLLARENYWRGIANSPESGRRSDTAQAEGVSPVEARPGSGESPLSLRERLQRRSIG